MSTTIGSRIRALRKDQGISLRSAAALLGVDPAYLSRVESNKVPPSGELLERAAPALGAAADELFLLAGRVPPEWGKPIAASPGRAASVIREALVHYDAPSLRAGQHQVVAFEGQRAIEDERFPFEKLSDIAEMESWRKEVYRPVYHVHKWWAQRLGSVFRAMILGAFAPKGSDVLEMFYQPARVPGAVIFDPFMGSGTTVGESLKVGARAVGKDINPVAYFAVKNALSLPSRDRLVSGFRQLEEDVAPRIRHYYRSCLAGGEGAETLYYFWVKVIPCPRCGQDVDLFSSWIFARHAYPARRPEAMASCARCGGINPTRYDAGEVTCSECGHVYDPQRGPAGKTEAHCPACHEDFPVARTVQALGRPLGHRMYAKMVLMPDGSKAYRPIDGFDRELFQDACAELSKNKHLFPVAGIEPGHNTDQVLGYCYTQWHQMFNERQLLCLGLLGQGIQRLDEDVRSAFLCLFSGVLEFNNMFASFKGEGTGAVRHMFSHHVLKPERTPLEANVWGTPKSSGAFSTLFRSRLLRAAEYCENPFEVRVISDGPRRSGKKVYGLSGSLGHEAARSWKEFVGGKQLYLACGDSSQTDMPAASVDAVITDPPFFDNVHYSELADFFYVWQRHFLDGEAQWRRLTTRTDGEVQHADARTFSSRLAGVFRECARVLKEDGLLVFTYHHSRAEGWTAVLGALLESGFYVTAAHPIKAEMSVGKPKHQAKEPIDIDVILVCRKRGDMRMKVVDWEDLLSEAAKVAGEQIARLNSRGMTLSRNDVRVILTAQAVRLLSRSPELLEVTEALDQGAAGIDKGIEALHAAQRPRRRTPALSDAQRRLFETV